MCVIALCIMAMTLATVVTKLKVYLDDERKTPKGWVRCCWPAEVIELLKSEVITELSLDHDLGDDERGTGYDVLIWLEKAVIMDGLVPPSRIVIHSANASAWKKMIQAIDAIERHAQI